MKTQYESARNALVSDCKKLVELNDITDFLITTSSWGQEPSKAINYYGRLVQSDKNVVVNPDHVKSIIRGYLQSEHIITTSVLSRLLLIRESCQKLNDGWSGVSSDINEFRFIAERYAVLCIIHEKFKDYFKDKKMSKDDLPHLQEICNTGLGTRFSWRDLWDKPFEEMSKTKYEYDEESDLNDLTSKSILGLIDRSDRKRMKGLRAFYEFCCEFVHPNIGDMVSCGFNLKALSDSDGSMLRIRRLSSVSSPDMGPELALEQKYILNAYAFANKIINDVLEMSGFLIEVVKKSKLHSRKFIHSKVKKTKSSFSPKDLCPCGSGLPVKACLKTKV